MQFLINKDKFNDIENAFTRLKANDSDISACRTISDALHSLTGRGIVVEVVKPTSKNQECYIMSVYPEESTIDKIINAIISESSDTIITQLWNDTSTWYVEIDSRILTEDMNFTERELAALLLHEVGHVVYSNSVPFKISKVVRFEFAKTHSTTRQVLKNNIFKKVLSFPILSACNFTRSKESLKNEMRADKYAVNSGYGKDLSNAIDKVIKYAGTLNNTEKDMSELMGFSVDTIKQLENRQNHLIRKNLQHMIVSTPSRFTQNVVKGVSNIFTGDPNSLSYNESKKDEYLYDKVSKISDDFYVSEAFFNRVHKLKRIDPADIDYIGLEINNIKSNDDKIMIISYIYSKLDLIDYYIELIDNKNPRYSIPHSRESLVKMRETLDKYRRDAIARKLPEINYGVNIVYPVGYEG